MIHEDYVIVDLASSDSNVDSRDSSRPDPWNERLDGLMSKKISNLEVGSSSTVPTYANDENTFFDVDLSMRVFGRDTTSVLDNNIVRGNDLVIYIKKGCEDRMFAQDARLRGTTGPLAACPYRGI
ncbi:predicted protein [Arabidopsis lyrata subsp. lyrata]|uniref:Predicted protein n=1 Tax=Arabidopsis lyrata subsp. lyrata TaxID=81972 RepID=D7ML32_ARALL|nr:predicted protein [Arabidopsis lyrata subsp. lyrata]